jgi:hypothetical protein
MTTEDQYRSLMAGRPMWEAHLDPKPSRRIVADQNDWLRLRAEKLGGLCRICEQRAAESLHHLCPKSLRGDDLAQNLVGLCGDGVRGCHGLVEARDPWACSLLGQKLTAAELEYLLEKKGSSFVQRYYGVKERAA